MNAIFRQVARIGKYHASLSGGQSGAMRLVLEDVAEYLTAEGCEVMVEQETANNTGLGGYPLVSVPDIGARCDLGLVVGGDGTMLGIGRQLAPFAVPLIGINQGRLGFITDISLERFRATLAPMLRGEYEEDRRSLMHARVMRDGHCVFDALAMNDVVANQRADGLIIATPTGATAYALSAGGPLLHPSIPGWVLVPIAPHTLSNRPIVLSDDTEVAIEIVAGREASANFDSQSLASLLHGDRISVRRSKHSIRFLHPRGWSYFDTLRKKLHWNEGGS